MRSPGARQRHLGVVILSTPLLIGMGVLVHLAGASTPPPPAGQNQIPTTPQDFFQPGSQPEPDEKVFAPIQSAFTCTFCHAEYLEDEELFDEPWDGWTNSMMGQAYRDPVWHAALAIANQDATDSGEYCIRCHAPGGWLGGRSLPADGSGLIDQITINDFEGIQCHFCHRGVNPVFEPDSPIEDAPILASLEFPPGSGRGNGRYVVDPDDVRRGPFQDIAENEEMNPHGVPVIYSPFHRRSEMCATCHDLGNPVFSLQKDGSYALNELDAAHPTQEPYEMFPEQRTYSEWLNSQFAEGGVLFEDRRFGGEHKTGIMEECQDCHMPDQVAGGCVLWEQDPWFERPDLPQHSFAGANRWVLRAVLELDDGGDTGMSPESVDAAQARVTGMMQAASDTQAVQLGPLLRMRVINFSGHKLPTGYPEGRRMWLNIAYFDEKGKLVEERGAYDFETAELVEDTKIYHCILAIDEALAEVVGLPAGPTGHLVLGNEILFDNRIPPMGFTNAAYDAFGGTPVGAEFADGQHWDDTVDEIPDGAVRARVTLYHQEMTRDYIEFLRDANTTNDAGNLAYDLWADPLVGAKAPPVDMDTLVVDFGSRTPGDVDADGAVDFNDLVRVLSAWGPCPPPDLCPEDLNADGQIGFNDLLIILTNWGR